MEVNYHNREWLVEKYWDEGLEQNEIADICGVDDSTISTWMRKNDIPTIFSEWVSKEELENLYHDKKLSMRDIADKFDVDSETIRLAMSKNGVEARDRLEYQKYHHPTLHIENEYPSFMEQSFGTNNRVKVHRLIMVAEHGIDSVKGMDVHHKNGVKWDNRPENLELKNPSEHMRHHALEKEMWKESPR